MPEYAYVSPILRHVRLVEREGGLSYTGQVTPNRVIAHPDQVTLFSPDTASDALYSELAASADRR